ncbi:hypothetical protein KX816_11015 [Sphingosinicellaceae bacterium]|nr:hypothetical protein KX816_11015 [Sphingosinicellaceae bacterium]
MRFIVVLACALLGACAASPGAMIVPVSQANIIAPTSPLHRSVFLKDVTGGGTSKKWDQGLSGEAFGEALRQSLAVHLMLGTGNAQYQLTAELVQLKQPMAGISMTVTARVHYTLTPSAGGAPVFDRLIETPYTAAFSDAFVGMKRLSLANEGAVRANIQALIDALVVQSKTDPKFTVADATVLSQLRELASN